MSLFEALLRFDTKVLGKYNINEPVKMVQKDNNNVIQLKFPSKSTEFILGCLPKFKKKSKLVEKITSPLGIEFNCRRSYPRPPLEAGFPLIQ